MISIIVCSIDGIKFRALAEMCARLIAPMTFELIRIHNARSMSEGYNRGIAASRGEILIFCHEDLEILSPDFLPRLQRHLERYDLIGLAGASRVCGTTWNAAGPPYTFGQVSYPEPNGRITVMIYGAPAPVVGNIQVMDGLFLAMNRPVVEKLRFDESFDGFHFYDLDFTLAAFKAGFKLAVANDIHALHQSAGKFSGPQWEMAAARFKAKWGAHFHPMTARAFGTAGVMVGSRAEVMEIAQPKYWDDLGVDLSAG